MPRTGDSIPKHLSTRRLAPLLALALLAVGCVARKPPVHPGLVQRAERTPVVLVPGITGTALRDTETGRTVWGKSRNVFWPRDGGYELAVPLRPGAGREDSLEPSGPLLSLTLLGFFRFEAYGPLVRMMERNGYRLGSLDDPRPGESFFVFSYDWRYRNERAVRELVEALERLRRARGDAVLEVDLICHSNAGRMVRWALKYGGATLEQAESGMARPPQRLRARNVILVGADNGGGLDTLRTFNRGRTYVPVVGRTIRPETVFTFESLFESLPVYREELFFDAEGRLLDVDLFEAESWRRYGWSIYGAEAQKRMARRDRADLFADEGERLRWLEGALDRARRTHDLLHRDVAGFDAMRLHFIRNVDRTTGERAMIVHGGDGEWKTRFVQDGKLRRDPQLSDLAAVRGDGYVTEESLYWVSPQELDALAGPPLDVRSGHRGLIRHPDSLRAILEILAAP
jgi:hypothetical protein